ncbi:early endosome antigen 1 isoform X2 [Aplysia californica]|uniref:Early endosome antigen 1 isoform X2 n=1 Tax=Aplysia californica TaxID=6500 RepID=A0ABM1A433_APLCA|nr:early endosome antigen 1 isoform X2 [Aplysia californica]
MEFQVFHDVLSNKENGVAGTKNKVIPNQETNSYPARTPLQDVRNKRIKDVLSGTSEVQKSDHRLEALDLLTQETPKKQRNKAVRSRRSCFASFDTHPPSSELSSVTLPQQVEEEPDCPPHEPLMSLKSLRPDDDGVVASTSKSNRVVVLDTVPELSLDQDCLGASTSNPRSDCTELERDESREISESVIEVGGEITLGASQDATKGQGEEGPNFEDNPHLPVIAVVERETDELVEMIVNECASELQQLSKSLAECSVGSLTTQVFSPSSAHYDHPYSQIYQKEASREQIASSTPLHKSMTEIPSSSKQSGLSVQTGNPMCSSTPVLHLQAALTSRAQRLLLPSPCLADGNLSTTEAEEQHVGGDNLRSHTAAPPCSPMGSTDNFWKGEADARQSFSTSLNELMNMSANLFQEKLEAQELSTMIEAYLLNTPAGGKKEEVSLSSSSVNRLLELDLTQSAPDERVGCDVSDHCVGESFSSDAESFAVIPPSPNIRCVNVGSTAFQQMTDKTKDLNEFADINIVNSDLVMFTPKRKHNDLSSSLQKNHESESRISNSSQNSSLPPSVLPLLNDSVKIHNSCQPSEVQGVSAVQMVEPSDFTEHCSHPEDDEGTSDRAGSITEDIVSHGLSVHIGSAMGYHSLSTPTPDTFSNCSTGSSFQTDSFYTSAITKENQEMEKSTGIEFFSSVCTHQANPTTHECTDNLVLTDPAIWEMVNRSMVTDRALREMVNRSMETDPTVQEMVNRSMVTDPTLQEMVNRSMVTDHAVQEMVNRSMVTDHTEQEMVNKSLMTDPTLQEMMNRSMMTEEDFSARTTDTRDLSVLAMVEALNKQTMTERHEMVDTGSGMTPVKLNKPGRRMTAEDVRRQHPRAVANQLETTMAANQRLEKEVKATSHERNRLQASLKECRGKLTSSEKQLVELRDNHTQDIALLEQLHEEALSGLQKCVEEKQNRIYQLEQELSQSSEMLRTAETSLSASVADLEQACESLELSRQEAEKRHAEEIERMQAEFAKNSYKDQFETSMKVIRELQTEREEFLGLMDDIEGASAMQFRLRDSLHHLARKTKKTVEDHAMLHRQLLSENESMRQSMASVQVDRDVAQAENRDLQEDLQHLNDIIQRSNNSLIELEKLYAATSQDLMDSQTHADRLNEELVEASEALDGLLTTKEVLTQQLSEQQDSETLACQALQESQEQLAEMEQLLDEKAALLSASQSEKEKLKADHLSMISKLELYIQNLQHTLDSWEIDREVHEEEMTEVREHLFESEKREKVMKKELVALRTVKATTQEEKSLLEELQNTNQFLEAEKQLYLDSITDFRTKLEAETELAASSRKLIEALESNNTELQNSNKQLQSDLTLAEEELTSRSSDAEASLSLIDNLEQKMDSVLSAVQKKFGIDVKVELAKDRVFANRRSGSANGDRRSLVSAVLSRAASSAPSPSAYKATPSPRLKQSNVEFGASLGRRNGKEAAAMISSSHSQSFCGAAENSRLDISTQKSQSFSEPFDSVMNRLFSNRSNNDSLQLPGSAKKESSLSPDEIDKSVAGFARIRSIPSTLDRSLETSRRINTTAGSSSSFLGLSDSADSQPVLEKVKSIDRIFTMILKAMNMAERASELTIRDLREDLEVLRNKLRFTESEEQKKSEQLTEVNAQVKELNARVVGMTNSMMNFQDQSYKINELEEEKEDLTLKLRHLEGEKTLLSNQLEEVIAKMDSGTAGKRPDGTHMREIVALKKKIYELQVSSADELIRNRELGEKAMKRMKILENNWQKAETDVARFDELVENIRKVCIKHQSRNTHPALLDIVRWIDGRQGQDTPSQARSYGPMETSAVRRKL